MQGLRIKTAVVSCLFAASILWPIAAGASTGTLVTAPSVPGKNCSIIIYQAAPPFLFLHIGLT